MQLVGLPKAITPATRQGMESLPTEIALKPVTLKVELRGRLGNIGKLKHWFMAIAEAVQNGMDSVESSGHEGSIRVTVIRTRDLLAESAVPAPIKSVAIVDDGIGFNDANFASFCTPDSSLKRGKGGKGLGRLMCLQAFEQVCVSSFYGNGNSFRMRTAILQLEAPELQAADITAQVTEPRTEVKLDTLRDKYAPAASASPEAVIDWLTEHFLPVLVEKPSWLKALWVEDGALSVDLMQLVSAGAAWRQEFQIRNYIFKLICYSVANQARSEQVRLVAGGRIVNANTQPVDHYLPHLSCISLSKPHLVLVHSAFFDEHVDDARNGVSFADDDENQLLGITAAEFRTACGGAMRRHLAERLTESSEAFKQRVAKIVTEEARHYRPLLVKYFTSKEFVTLSTDAKDEDVLTSLDLFRRRDATRMKTESKRIARLKAGTDGYEQSARDLAEQIEIQKKVALAEYVSLRKIILDRLEHLIAANDSGEGHREAAIHDLVFAQRMDSESAYSVDHQLWILDERLESHDYLASDQPLDGKRGSRPDLLIALDSPGAFACPPFSKASGYERIVIVEFKKALKELSKLRSDEWPHHQMIRYAQEIEQGGAKHFTSKRVIDVTSNVRFYMYAVCELSESFLKNLATVGFTKAPSGDGAFMVTNGGRYYMEYISLPKLLEDAKCRNAAFFRRLGLD